MTKTITVIIIHTMTTVIFGQHSNFFNDKKLYANYKCPTGCTIKVDGVLTDSSWSDTPWISDFTDIIGRANQRPNYETKVKTRWDDAYLYLGAEIYQEHIWATIDKNDSTLYLENVFEIFIDPSGDTHNYFEIEVNALGTVWDLMLTKPYRDGGVAINSWDVKGLKKGVSINGTINNGQDKDIKWTLELAIPLQELMINYAEIENKFIRVNLARTSWDITYTNGAYERETDDAYYWVWSPQNTLSFHEPEQWGYLCFLDEGTEMKDILKSHAESEYYKYVLRKIYYAQHSSRTKNGTFIRNLEDMLIHDSIKENINVFTTPSLFEAILKYKDKLWHIDQAGKTWCTLE